MCVFRHHYTDGSKSHDMPERKHRTKRELEDGEKPSSVIVQSVAALSNNRITELDPLAHSIDPDAVDAFLTHKPGPSLTFHYSGFEVTADSQKVIIEYQ